MAVKTGYHVMHVVPRVGTLQWAVKRSVGLRALKLFRRREEAAAVAEAWLRAEGGGTLYVHRRDGIVERKVEVAA